MSFNELSESDIKCLVPKLGVVKKICRLQSSVSWIDDEVIDHDLLVPVFHNTHGRSLQLIKKWRQHHVHLVWHHEAASSPLWQINLVHVQVCLNHLQGLSPLWVFMMCVALRMTMPLLHLLLAKGIYNSWHKTLNNGLYCCVYRWRVKETGIPSEISWDLVTQMYSCNQRPDRAYCTFVAKSLSRSIPLWKTPLIKMWQFSAHCSVVAYN